MLRVTQHRSDTDTLRASWHPQHSREATQLHTNLFSALKAHEEPGAASSPLQAAGEDVRRCHSYGSARL